MKNYVLDTSVLLYDPMSIFQFEDNNVILPLTVLEELDTFKDGSRTANQNARQVIRTLEGFRSGGSLTVEHELENGGTIKAVDDEAYQKSTEDLTIINVANCLDATVVTKDLNMRIRADVIGVRAEDYEAVRSSVREEPVRTVYIDENQMSGVFDGTPFALQDMGVNEHAHAVANGDTHALIRQHADGLCYSANVSKAYSIKPRNREQHFALDVLLDPDINLVVLSGKAGTGKTLLALAAGLEQVVNGDRSRRYGHYRKLVVGRPFIPMGRDMGYLPGTIEEKVQPWMKPIYDNLDFLTRGSSTQNGVKDLEMFNFIEVEPLTYIRGRSIPGQFMVIDEAQNLTPHEVKTIITRAGEGTKIVLTGDPYQIDSAYLDESSNALSYVAERMEGEEMFAAVHLLKGERSELAEVATKRL